MILIYKKLHESEERKMIKKQFKEKELSMLGFGMMRLPQNSDGSIAEENVAEMVDYALKNGVNYFDTAYPYHEGMSEIVAGKVLSKYPRDSFNLASKYPGHQISSSYNPAVIFEEQLKKCKVDYFDFYLLHNVCENSIETYLSDKWKIVDYFVEQRKLGRIKHLGFSSHALPETLKIFLDRYSSEMEFCQIQLNYLDWSLQNAKEKCEILASYGIPVWVMEPLHGGKLAVLPEGSQKKIEEAGSTPVSMAFRWLQGIEGVTMVLSGMSSLEQMKENIEIFDKPMLLSEKENELLYEIAEEEKKSVPCTACRYCCDGCPQEIDIPKIISAYNDFVYSKSFTSRMYVESLEEGKRPGDCVSCGQCAEICPQKIDIPSIMEKFANELSGLPTWKELSKQREEAAKKIKK